METITEANYDLDALANHETHWFECRVCGGKSLDSDTRALMGATTLAPADVMHFNFCPGRAFPDKHVRRVARMY